MLRKRANRTMEQLALPLDAVCLRRIDLALNMRRFYTLTVARDLFGRWLLVRQWGRIGANGQSLSEEHENEADALASLTAIAAAKRRRGYRNAGEIR